MTSNISRRNILAGLGATAGILATPYISRAQSSGFQITPVARSTASVSSGFSTLSTISRVAKCAAIVDA